MPRTLHLVKHGRPDIVPGVPAHEWALAPGALDGLDALAARLRPRPQLVVSSEEPKARATAAALAGLLGVPWRPMVGLHEQLRYTASLHADPADFQAELRGFFARPGEVVSGEESADDTHTRFRNAVNAVMRANPQDVVAVVAHGTVISLLAARAANTDPYALWASLGLLEHVTLGWPAGPEAGREPAS